MIEMRNITKRFGRFVAVDNVSLDISSGESVALWGPNGAGKSTLIRCLLGLLPFKGDASVGGLSVRRYGKAARRLMGYLPQEPALFDDLRVVEVTMLFARLKRASINEARRMLGDIGLDQHARKRVRQLSGGMKQRLALGLALLNDPPAIVLDEPTSHLDESGRMELLDDIDRLRRVGKTILLISHRPEEVKQIADRVVTLESGRIVRDEATMESATQSAEASLIVDRVQVDRALEALHRAGVKARSSQNGKTDHRSPVSNTGDVSASIVQSIAERFTR